MPVDSRQRYRGMLSSAEDMLGKGVCVILEILATQNPESRSREQTQEGPEDGAVVVHDRAQVSCAGETVEHRPYSTCSLTHRAIATATLPALKTMNRHVIAAVNATRMMDCEILSAQYLQRQ